MTKMKAKVHLSTAIRSWQACLQTTAGLPIADCLNQVIVGGVKDCSLFCLPSS